MARQLVAGHDEVRVITQCDCLQHGNRAQAKSAGGFLTEAIRGDYPLSYAAEEPEAFMAIMGLYSQGERDCYHVAGLRICGLSGDLFAAQEDAREWPIELRAVMRFMMCHSLEPELVQAVGEGGVADAREGA